MIPEEQRFWSRHLSYYQRQGDIGPSQDSRFPREILERIFLKCTQDFAPFRIPTRKHLQEAFSLAQVCHQWRDILLSLPTYWATVIIYHPRRSTIPLVQLSLIRSSTCPLRLKLIDSSPLGGSARDIMEMLQVHIHRWKQVAFRLGGDHPFGERSHLGSRLRAAKELEHLGLDLPGCTSAYRQSVWSYLGSSPLLKEVDLIFTEDPHLLRLPWQKIASIQMPLQVSLSIFFRTLANCTNLTELIVRSSGFDETQPINTRTPIRLPRLTNLSLSLPSPSFFVFEHLITPSLEDLRISVRGQITSHETATFNLFLRRSSCTIKHLRFHNISQHTSSLVSLLSSPALRHLESVRIGATLDDTLVASLTTSECLTGPSLKRLELYICKTITDGLLGEFLKAKKAGGLQEVSVEAQQENLKYFQDNIDIDSLQRLGLLINFIPNDRDMSDIASVLYD